MCNNFDGKYMNIKILLDRYSILILGRFYLLKILYVFGCFFYKFFLIEIYWNL